EFNIRYQKLQAWKLLDDYQKEMEIKTRLESFTKEQINWAQEKAEIAAEKMADFQAAIGGRQITAESENEVGKLEDYQKLIKEFQDEFFGPDENILSAVWKKKNEGYVPKSANASLPELERKAQQDVWTDEELTALEKEIAEFPPYIEKQPKPKYYRGFQLNYQNRESINQRLERAKEGAKKNVDDYQAAIEKINAILNKNVDWGYKKVMPFFVEEDLTPPQQKVKQVKGDAITERLLALEKKKYLAENEKESNEYEKEEVEKTKKLAILKKVIREYFTTAEKLTELKAGFILDYQSATGRKQTIKCLSTDYDSLDLILEQQAVSEKAFNNK
ncbi:1310_t:CDS:2, partial [Cetraspora pellucida]